MLEEDQRAEETVARVAACDIGKAELVCCVRVPHPQHPDRRLQEVVTYSTMTRSLLVMADRLAELGVSKVVMEATSDYWKPVYYLLEAYGHGLSPELVNARDVKHLPGRPKTDRLDAVWLCKVAERGMIRPSFVPPPEIRRLRDVTRYRADLVQARTAEKQRVEKLLEDAQIKLSVTVSDIFGTSGRDMLAALIAGQRDPRVLAGLARTRMRGKPAELEEAFTGYFTDHHAALLTKMLARVDGLSADIADLEATIEQMIAPFAAIVAKLDEVPGIGRVAAAAILAEVGPDMSRCPTPAHLCAWARFAPGTKESAGKKVGQGTTGHGNRYLAKIIGEAAVGAGRTNTFLGERYRRLARRRGRKKALVAVGRSILVIIWHLLADPDAHFIDLGPDFHVRRNDPERRKRAHIQQLEALGYTVTLSPAARRRSARSRLEHPSAPEPTAPSARLRVIFGSGVGALDDPAPADLDRRGSAAGGDLAAQAPLVECFSAGPVVLAGVQMHPHVGGQGLEVLERVQGLAQQGVVAGVGRRADGGHRHTGAVGQLGPLHPALAPVHGAATSALPAAGRLGRAAVHRHVGQVQADHLLVGIQS